MASFGDSVGNIYVTTNATLIYKVDGLRDVVSIYNNGTTTGYLGSGTAVTTANGYPVPVVDNSKVWKAVIAGLRAFIASWEGNSDFLLA